MKWNPLDDPLRSAIATAPCMRDSPADLFLVTIYSAGIVFSQGSTITMSLLFDRVRLVLVPADPDGQLTFVEVPTEGHSICARGTKNLCKDVGFIKPSETEMRSTTGERPQTRSAVGAPNFNTSCMAYLKTSTTWESSEISPVRKPTVRQKKATRVEKSCASNKTD